MLGQKPAPLRSALLNLKIQPTLLTPCTATPTSIPIRRRLNTITHNKPPSIPEYHHTPPTKQTNLTTIRNITQVPSPTTTTPQPQIQPQTQTQIQNPYTPSPSPPLTWNTYLALRKTRRRYNLSFSLATSLSTTLLGASYLAQLNIENLTLFGLDPMITLGISMTACMGAGWLMGPFLGNALFKVRYRQQWGQIAAKEMDLFRRIKKYRVDGSGGSSANPVPDYYGEKIDSVRAYRNWMKDQRAFNKKRQNYF